VRKELSDFWVQGTTIEKLYRDRLVQLGDDKFLKYLDELLKYQDKRRTT